MKDVFIAIVFTHFSNFLPAADLRAFRDQPDAVMGISTEHSLAVLDDDQFAISNKPVSAVNDGSCCCGPDFLSLYTSDIQSVTRWVIGQEMTYHASLNRPNPGVWIRRQQCRFLRRCRRFGGRNFSWRRRWLYGVCGAHGRLLA